MITNYHTHSTFCDGKNTPEEVVRYAIHKGFAAIGFSGHGFTPFDLRYCMKDTEGYIADIKRLKKMYENKIQIYLGVEEDAFSPLNRADFDYVIGSSHYYLSDGTYFPIDSSYEHFKVCLDIFKYDVEAMAEQYFASFCDYILKRKPDIIGHFDLITKFDELDIPLFLDNAKYNAIAERYVKIAATGKSLFEVNTGAMSRNLRTAPYPAENLLHILKKEGAGLILSSDSHNTATLDAYFEETKAFLKNIGFDNVYSLLDGKFTKQNI